MKVIKPLLFAMLISLATICQAEENRYFVLWTAGAEGVTMDEIADLEEALQILFGEGKAWIAQLQVLPETGETEQQDIPTERDI